jgi:hypothetical protein
MGFLTLIGRLIKKNWVGVCGGLQHCASFLREYVGALQRWGWAYKLPLGVVYVGVCLLLGLYVRLALTGLLLSLLGLRHWVLQLPAVKRELAEYAAASAVMNTHWAKDHDLGYVWRFIVFCSVLAVALFVVICFCITQGVGITWVFLGLVPIATPWLQSLFWIPFYLGALSFTIYCGAVFHIVLYRNPVVPTGAKAALIKVGVVGLKAAVGGTILLDLTSRATIFEPNGVTNKYRVYSPIGPGYGYTDTGSRVMMYGVQTTQLDTNPLMFVDAHGNVCGKKIHAYLVANPALVRSKTTLAQRIALGLSR